MLETWIDGQLVARNGHSLIQHVPAGTLNQFSCSPKTGTVSDQDFHPFTDTGDRSARRTTHHEQTVRDNPARNGFAVADLDNDLLPITALSIVTGSAAGSGLDPQFWYQARRNRSSVAHDSHNIVAVGVDAESIAAAVNAVIEVQGG